MAGPGESIDFEAITLHQAEIKISQHARVGGLAVEGPMLAVGQATPNHKSRQVGVVVRIGVSHAAAQNDRGGIQKGPAIGVPVSLQLVQEKTEPFYMLSPDHIVLGYFLGLIAVMRQPMVARAEATPLDIENLTPSRDQKGQYAGRIGGESESHQNRT